MNHFQHQKSQELEKIHTKMYALFCEILLPSFSNVNDVVCGYRKYMQLGRSSRTYRSY